MGAASSAAGETVHRSLCSLCLQSKFLSYSHTSEGWGSSAWG